MPGDARPASPLAGGPLAPYDALLFDLDGVITDTAAVHARAWKALFDHFLRDWSVEHGEPFRPFGIADDYTRYVDGMRRYDGVARFLESRGISLPTGEPTDSVETMTVCGLGNRKDRHFLEAIDEHGVEVFADTRSVLDTVHGSDVHLAVVSASENCDAVLRRVGLIDRFDARVTGREATAWGLRGKPRPDTFLKAADLLDADPEAAVVFEDAISGVQAGREGGFGLVVGVDRGGAAESLRLNGADIVVSDLRTLLAP